MAENAFHLTALEQACRTSPTLNALIKALTSCVENGPKPSPTGTPPVDLLTSLLALQDATDHSALDAKEVVQPNAPPSYTPLGQETRTTLPTKEAAFQLSRAQQTLRLWAMSESGPLRPIRINGRLHWKTEDIRKLLGVA